MTRDLGNGIVTADGGSRDSLGSFRSGTFGADQVIVRVIDTDAAGLQRLRRERSVLIGLTSRYLLPWREIVAGPADKSPTVVFVSDPPAGPTLSAELSAGLSLTAAQAARLGADLALGLVALHAAGLVHGAIQPDLVRRNGEPGRGQALPSARLSGVGVRSLAAGGLPSETDDLIGLAGVVGAVLTTAGVADEQLSTLLAELADPASGRTARDAATRLATISNRLSSSRTAVRPPVAAIGPAVPVEPVAPKPKLEPNPGPEPKPAYDGAITDPGLERLRPSTDGEAVAEQPVPVLPAAGEPAAVPAPTTREPESEPVPVGSRRRRRGGVLAVVLIVVVAVIAALIVAGNHRSGGGSVATGQSPAPSTSTTVEASPVLTQDLSAEPITASQIGRAAKPLENVSSLSYNSLLQALYAYCDYYTPDPSTEKGHSFVGYSSGIGINIYEDVTTYTGSGAEDLLAGIKQSLARCPVLMAKDDAGNVLGTFKISPAGPLTQLPASQVGLLYERTDMVEAAVQAVFLQQGDTVAVVLAQGRKSADLGDPLDRAAFKALAKIPAS